MPRWKLYQKLSREVRNVKKLPRRVRNVRLVYLGSIRKLRGSFYPFLIVQASFFIFDLCVGLGPDVSLVGRCVRHSFGPHSAGFLLR